MALDAKFSNAALLRALEDRSDDAGSEAAARRRFLHEAARELEGPLAALSRELGRLRGLDLASDEPSERLVTTSVELIARHVARVTGVVDNFSQASRILSGSMDLKREAIDLAAVASQAVTDAEAAGYPARRLVTVRATGTAMGLWERGSLRSAVYNLVANALTFGGGKPVDVIVVGSARHASLQVVDRGIGVRPEDVAKIFDEFVRVGAVDGAHGFGIGLWIVRNVVEAHGGTIALSSAPDRGTTVSVELPVRFGIESHARDR